MRPRSGSTCCASATARSGPSSSPSPGLVDRADSATLARSRHRSAEILFEDIRQASRLKTHARQWTSERPDIQTSMPTRLSGPSPSVAPSSLALDVAAQRHVGRSINVSTIGRLHVQTSKRLNERNSSAADRGVPPLRLLAHDVAAQRPSPATSFSSSLFEDRPQDGPRRASNPSRSARPVPGTAAKPWVVCAGLTLQLPGSSTLLGGDSPRTGFITAPPSPAAPSGRSKRSRGTAPPRFSARISTSLRGFRRGTRTTHPDVCTFRRSDVRTCLGCATLRRFELVAAD